MIDIAFAFAIGIVCGLYADRAVLARQERQERELKRDRDWRERVERDRDRRKRELERESKM